jgi:hypothetical protein
MMETRIVPPARADDPRIVGEVVRLAFDEDASAPVHDGGDTGWQRLEQSLLGDAIGAAALLVALVGGMAIVAAVLS